MAVDLPPQVEALVGSCAPDRKVAGRRHGATRYTDLGLYTSDLPRARPSLDLLNAIGVHPDACPATTAIPATG